MSKFDQSNDTIIDISRFQHCFWNTLTVHSSLILELTLNKSQQKYSFLNYLVNCNYQVERRIRKQLFIKWFVSMMMPKNCLLYFKEFFSFFYFQLPVASRCLNKTYWVEKEQMTLFIFPQRLRLRRLIPPSIKSLHKP